MYTCICHVYYLCLLTFPYLLPFSFLFSTLLSINIGSISSNGVDLLPSRSVSLCECLSVCLLVRKVYCGKTAECWMLFGMVSGVGQGMGVLNGGGDRRRGRAVLEVNLMCSIVTNGDFVA